MAEVKCGGCGKDIGQGDKKMCQKCKVYFHFPNCQGSQSGYCKTCKP